MGGALRELPWFPFWAKDWVTDEAIVAMSAESRGIYITLLAHQWIEGSIPEPGPTLARLCAVDARSIRAKAGPVIRAHFVPLKDQPGRFVNLRLSVERERQLANRERLARSGALGAARRWQMPSHMPSHLPEQMPPRGHTEAETEVHQFLLEQSGNGLGPYSAAFEQAWTGYPKRTGGNSKRSAFRAWTARLKAGASPADMLAGVERYRRYCEATGKLGTEYVKQAATFFGPDEHFREPWATPSDAAPASRKTFLTAVEFDAHERLRDNTGATH
jgi:uncharacterized protein YdaU (DUF1376 family)